MACDEKSANRVRKVLAPQKKHIEEKKMMSGLTFMLRDNMCVGALKDELMCRIDPKLHNEAIQGCRTMGLTKKPMKGFVFVNPSGTYSEKGLKYWIWLVLEFHAKAKSYKKK